MITANVLRNASGNVRSVGNAIEENDSHSRFVITVGRDLRGTMVDAVAINPGMVSR